MYICKIKNLIDMKNKILLLVFICLAQVGFGQVTQFKQFSAKSLNFTVINSSDILVLKDSTKIEIYDSGFNLKKQISGLPSSSQILLQSKNVFTLSGKMEFILAVKNNTTNNNEFKLYNEDKQLLFDFGEYSPFSFINGKLITYKYVMPGDGTYSVDIKAYSIAGNVSAAMIEESKNKIETYPNPTSAILNIKYNVNTMQEMVIRDMQGKVIENILLDPARGQFELNVGGYAKGVYIYSYGNSSGKFIVQ